MKYVLVIADGAADYPVKNGKTPFEIAEIPNIQYLAKKGKTGLLKTMFRGLPVESDVAILGLIGYRPTKFYPGGRASFEALAKKVRIGENDLAFRCNFISLNDGAVSDFTADMIEEGVALSLIKKFKIKTNGIELYHGLSYRNILICRDANVSPKDISCFPPHNSIGKQIMGILIQGKNKKSTLLVDNLNQLMLKSINQLKELNKTYNSKADMLWLWSPSSKPDLTDFYQTFGLKGAIVTSMDFLKGIGYAANIEVINIRGATGYLETNLKNKVDASKKLLERNDFVVVHINAPDEESHQGNIENKITAIERIDREIVCPLTSFLEAAYPKKYRIIFTPDHYTSLSGRIHLPKEVPFIIYGAGVKNDGTAKYSENGVNQTFKLEGFELIHYLKQDEI